MDTQRTIHAEKPNRRRYAREEIGVPTILAIFLWLGIWLIWPWEDGGRPVRRTPTRMRVFCSSVRYDSGIPGFTPGSFPRPAAFDPAADGVAPVSIPTPDILPPRFIPRPVDMMPAVTVPEESHPLSLRARQSLGEYAPLTQTPVVFSSIQTGSTFEVICRMSRDLADRGFEIPAGTLDPLRHGRENRQVVLTVNVDKDGHVEQIFLETGSGNREIDAIAIRAASSGRAPAGGRQATGTVTVDMGSR